MHIILVGIQGSGKGTQAANIIEHYGYENLEMGGILRGVLQNPSHRHYDEVNGTVPKGKMTPDPVIFDLIEEFMQGNSDKNILIDGAIRNMTQREYFDKITTDYVVIFLELTEEEAIRRIEGRRVDPETKEIFGADFEGDVNPATGNELITRVDDQDLEKIKERFSWFRSDIMPLVESWRDDETPFYAVDAGGSREQVWEDIQSVVESLSDD